MWATCEPHMSCMWGAPLHHWGNATREGITMPVSHTWAVREGLPSTFEEMLHVRALPFTWATHELYVRGSPPPLKKCYMWGHYRAREPHVRCTWVSELYVRGSPPPLKKCYTWGHYHACEPHVSHTWAVCEGLLSTIEEMLHMRALPCMWATCELYMRGSPWPLRECYTWGHYRACEPHVSCTWEAPLHHWGNAAREGITVHVSHTWAVREGLPSTIEGMLHMGGITVHVSHTWLACMHTAPLHLPKKVTEKPSVNHIGSSMSHQILQKFVMNVAQILSRDVMKWHHGSILCKQIPTNDCSLK